MKKIIIPSLISLLFANTSFATAQNDLIIPKIKQKITLDGNLDEDFWKSATKVELGFETRPAENKAAPVKTTAYIAENGDSLFVAFVAEDPKPDEIQASLKDRDTIWADDLVGFKVDTFNDSRKAFNFFVNPLGIQMDSVEDDVSGNEDMSWNGIWFSEGKLTENGYTVEIEIPFKVFRFPNTTEEKTWGIDFMRMYPRDHQYRLAYSPVKRDISCFVCQIGKIKGFKDIKSGQNIEIAPYVSGQRSENRNRLASNNWENGNSDYDGGVDFRWGVTDNSVLSATINPDFSQVESDALQFDVNTQFALFYQEQRPFFVEGADYFNTPFNLVHTRNIADPDYGVKYTGKSDGHSYGVLLAHDKFTSYLEPGSQSSGLRILDNTESDNVALRYTYDIGEKSQIGAIYTQRSADNYKNSVTGVDGKYQITDEDVLQYQFVHSNSADPSEDQTTQLASESGFGYALGYRHNGRNWNWNAEHREIDADFRADLGFMGRAGYKKDVIGLRHDWFPEEGSSITRFDIGGDIDATYDESGQKLEEEAEIRMSMNAAYQSWFGMGAGVRDAWFRNGVNDNLEDNEPPLLGALCTLGCWFDQNFYWAGMEFRPVTSLQLGFNYNHADSVDFSEYRPGKNTRSSMRINWQATRKLHISTRFNKSKFKIAEGELFNSEIVNLSSTFQFDKESYLRFTLRYSNTDYSQTLYDVQRSPNVRRLGRQLLYTYKLNPRTAFFFGYSDKYQENNSTEILEEDGRSIFTKFSYALQI